MIQSDNSMNRLIFFPLLLASVFGARGDSIKAAVICAGAATLNNGSVVTIGQPFVGTMWSADNAVSLNAGILPPLKAIVMKNPIQIETPRLVDGRFQMTFATRLDLAYRVEASTNLVNWLPIWNKDAGINSPLFEDTDAPRFGFRFYRVLGQ